MADMEKDKLNPVSEHEEHEHCGCGCEHAHAATKVTDRAIGTFAFRLFTQITNC